MQTDTFYRIDTSTLEEMLGEDGWTITVTSNKGKVWTQGVHPTYQENSLGRVFVANFLASETFICVKSVLTSPQGEEWVEIYRAIHLTSGDQLQMTWTLK